MSILIKGMEMPKTCAECPLLDYSSCKVSNECGGIDLPREEHKDCPLIEVPPHGDLIEESKVLDIVFEWCSDDDGSVGKDGDLREMLDEIEALPIIIEAEGE